MQVLSSVFPHWLSGSGGDDGDGDTSFSFQMTSDMGAAAATEEDEGLVAPQDSHVSFRGCLYVPGVFHILDGATHTLLNQSELWAEVKPLYESTVRFFHYGRYRRFFVSCCVSDPVSCSTMGLRSSKVAVRGVSSPRVLIGC